MKVKNQAFKAGLRAIMWNMIYKPWWQDEHYQKAAVLMYYEPTPIAESAPDTQMFIDRIAANLDVNIIPYIEAHPETTFTIFYPPYSILYWNNICRGKELIVGHFLSM